MHRCLCNKYNFLRWKGSKMKQINKISEQLSEMKSEMEELNRKMSMLYEMIKHNGSAPELIQELKKWDRQRKYKEYQLKEKLANRYEDTARKYTPHLNSSSTRKLPDSRSYDKNGRLK